MHVPPGPESRRLLEKLLREIVRAERQAVDHPAWEARRIGETAPVLALRDVALHAAMMRPRFEGVLRAHELVIHRGGIGGRLTSLRHLVTDRVTAAERSFRAALLDLRHGLDVAHLLREVARREMKFGLIRWCDDWLGARRTLVARVEAQLAWFAELPVAASAPSSRARGPRLAVPAEQDHDDAAAVVTSPTTLDGR